MIFVADDGAHTVTLRKVVHVLRLRGRDSKRMFAINVLARVERRHHDLVMHRRPHAHAHDVDFGKLVEHALDVVERVRHLKARAPRRRFMRVVHTAMVS